jgi:hypothetical protein
MDDDVDRVFLSGLVVDYFYIDDLYFLWRVVECIMFPAC